MQRSTFQRRLFAFWGAILLIVSAMPHENAFAVQEPAPPVSTQPDSSLRQTQPDSLAKPSADSTRAKPVRRRFLADSLLPAERALSHFQPSDRINLLYEDTAELLDALPGMRISRSGDLGHFSQVSQMGAPARFASLRFDGMDWPVGFYGQSNLSAVPEVLADRITLQPGSNLIDLQSAAPLDPRPWTYVEYVKGPFDIDVMRVRFRRSLSRKIQPYFSLNLANSDGQQTIVDNDARGGPYDALRMTLRTDYLLSPELRLQYRLLSSDNEAVVATPYFFEELPEILDTGASFKETRSLHALALTNSLFFGDSSRQNISEHDRYRFEIYRWGNREEMRDDLKAGVIEHKNSIYGGRATWSLFAPRWSGTAIAKMERHNFTSPTITQNAVNLATVAARAQFKWSRSLLLDGELQAMQHSDFGMLISGLARVALAPVTAWQLYGALTRDYSMPGPAEYANELSGILTGNSALDAARLDKVELGFQRQKGTLQFMAAFNYSMLNHPLELALADTVLQFRNREQARRYFGYAISGKWLPVHGMQIDLNSTGTFDASNADYFFWYLPQVQHALEFRYGRAIFNNDLRVVAQLQGRYIGERSQPVFATGALPGIQKLGGGFLADGQIKLLYKDAVIFFRLENLLDEALEWRFAQLMRGRAFRYGINWEFWN